MRWSFAASVFLLGLASPAPARPPNVIVILADDMGYGDMSAHGSPHVETPALDRLFSESTEFRQFYVTPLCAPTRASLLTGRLPLRTGVWHVWGGAEALAPDERTIAHRFAAAGYATGFFGKWHNGETYPATPAGMGFAEHINFRDGGVRSQFNPRLEANGRWFTAQGYTTDLFTAHAIDFISRHRQRPFFLYLPHAAPHAPLEAPPALLDRFKRQGLPAEEAALCAMMGSLDENVARLLDHVRELGLQRDTIVVFLSDNGPAKPDRFNAGLRGLKGSVYEGGIRAPCAIRWPGRIPAGLVLDAPAAVQDLFPTLSGLCGLRLDPVRPVDGADLSAWILGSGPAPAERPLFTFQPPAFSARPGAQPGGAVRLGRFKMVNGTELYDLVADPRESRNLAAAQPAQLAALNETYATWWRAAAAERDFRLPTAWLGTPENPVLLKCHHAEITPGLTVAGEASGRWIKWNDVAGRSTWNLDVRQPGRFHVALQMQCAPADAGSTVAVAIGAREIFATVTATPLGPRPESILPVGDFDLLAGPHRLAVRVAAARAHEALELKGVLLTRLPAPELSGRPSP